MTFDEQITWLHIAAVVCDEDERPLAAKKYREIAATVQVQSDVVDAAIAVKVEVCRDPGDDWDECEAIDRLCEAVSEYLAVRASGNESPK